MNDAVTRMTDYLLPWLLEPDRENPGVRYRALRELEGRPQDDEEVLAARAEVMRTGPVSTNLEAQEPEGFWAKPGGGHSPSCRVTMWQTIFLAELGADPADERVRRGCEYFLTHSVAANGGFSMNPKPTPSSVVHCLNGDPLHTNPWLRIRSESGARPELVGAGCQWRRRAALLQIGHLRRRLLLCLQAPALRLGRHQGHDSPERTRPGAQDAAHRARA